LDEIRYFLYTLRPSRLERLSEGPTPEEAAIISEHFAYLEALTEQGIVLLAGRTLTTDERTFGIVVLKAESQEAARAIMANDPGVKGGVQRAELFPYRIAPMARL